MPRIRVESMSTCGISSHWLTTLLYLDLVYRHSPAGQSTESTGDGSLHGRCLERPSSHTSASVLTHCECDLHRNSTTRPEGEPSRRPSSYDVVQTARGLPLQSHSLIYDSSIGQPRWGVAFSVIEGVSSQVKPPISRSS